MKRFPTLVVLAALIGIAFLNPPLQGDDWPQWRGPLGTGYAPDANPPIEFSDTMNVRWKTAIPGKGHASPIVLDDRIYLMTAVPTDMLVPPDPNEKIDPDKPDWLPKKPDRIQGFVVLAVDRHTGKIIWQTLVGEKLPNEGGHPTNTFASTSPITDGKRIFANFGSNGLYCLDMNGKVLWKQQLGAMETRNNWGEGASPALAENTLIVPWDHEGDSFVVAFDAPSGREKWRAARDERTTWATPVIVEVNQRHQVILAGNDTCISYDLATGDEIWRCRGLTRNVTPSPMIAHGMVYLMSGYRGSALIAVKLDQAKGDITDTDAIAWTHNRGTPYIPSGMIAGRNIYFLGSNNGILSCFDAITGEANYVGQRLGPVRNVYSSIVGANGYLYICGREGNVAVVREGSEFEIVATNSMGQGINASPAIVGDTIYIRGDTHLFCISATP